MLAVMLLCIGLVVRDYRARKLHDVVQPIGLVFGEVSFQSSQQTDASVLARFLRLAMGDGVEDIRQVDMPISRDSVTLLDTLKSIPNLERLNHNVWYQADIDRLSLELPNVEFGDSRVGEFLPLDTSTTDELEMAN